MLIANSCSKFTSTTQPSDSLNFHWYCKIIISLLRMCPIFVQILYTEVYSYFNVLTVINSIIFCAFGQIYNNIVLMFAPFSINIMVYEVKHTAGVDSV